MAISSKKSKNKIDLLILTDEFNENSSKKKIIEDLDRQNFLIDLGYSVYKITDLDWIFNKEKILKDIKKLLVNNQ